MRVLVVEDEISLAQAVERGLTAEGFEVDVVHNGLEGVARAREGNYGAIVLDILLPGMNGYKVCATLREEGVWTPILMLTAKDGEYDEAEALDTGADDFLSKPFSFVVLVARLRALGRRGDRPRPETLTVGDLVLDPATRSCVRAERADHAHDARVRVARGAHAAQRRRRLEAPTARRGVGSRLRGRPEHRRGLRRIPAAQGRHAVLDPHASSPCAAPATGQCQARVERKPEATNDRADA